LREYADLALAGRFDEAAAISKTLDPVRAVSHRWIMGRWAKTGIIPIAAIKAWSELVGMAAGPVRTPLLQMSDADRRTLRDEVMATGLLAARPETAVA
jgi:4-hydroxy-tetrahydrodipicolinate synthase